ncbi:MAG: Fis family transcriptional regulator [Ottowia sp.]|nr:Fis family transcriptional regulator [Ottowia sp.]
MKKIGLRECMHECMQDYFRNLGGAEPSGLYGMVLRAVEKPLLEVVMAQAGGNQSRAAQWLGLNRNTLRKKLAENGLLDAPPVRTPKS